MTLEKRLLDLQEACGLDTILDTADYVLMHYNAFDPEFVAYCQKVLE